MRKLKLNYLRRTRLSEATITDLLRDIRPETETLESIINKEITRVKLFLRKGKYAMDDQGVLFEDAFYFKYVTVRVNIDRRYYIVPREERGCLAVSLTISQSGLFRNLSDVRKIMLNKRRLILDEFTIRQDHNGNVVVSFLVLSTLYKMRKTLFSWVRK